MTHAAQYWLTVPQNADTTDGSCEKQQNDGCNQQVDTGTT